MKLSPLTIYIIGASLFVVIFTFGLFQHYLPNKQEIELLKTNVEAHEAEAAKLPRAQDRVNKAKAAVLKADRDWKVYVATRTLGPNLASGGIDLKVNRWQLSVDARKFRNNVQRRLNAQLRSGGVEVLSGPYVPGIGENDSVNQILTGYFNVGIYNFPVVVYDLGQVTVRGTYDEILANVRSWARMPRFLAVADGLSISGTSPNLTGTYNLQLVGFIQGNTYAPPVPEGQVAASGAGGFPGGGAGFPGAPSGFGGPGGGRGGRPSLGISGGGGGAVGGADAER